MAVGLLSIREIPRVEVPVVKKKIVDFAQKFTDMSSSKPKDYTNSSQDSSSREESQEGSRATSDKSSTLQAATKPLSSALEKVPNVKKPVDPREV